MNVSKIVAQNAIDTTFPTIKNDPNINLDVLEQSEPEPDEVKSKKKNKTVATLGETQSFFTNIIRGLVILVVGIAIWWLYQKRQAKQEYEE